MKRLNLTGFEILSGLMLEINRAYRDYAVASNQYDKEALYLFVLPTGAAPEIKDSPEMVKLGDMFSKTRISGVKRTESRWSN